MLTVSIQFKCFAVIFCAPGVVNLMRPLVGIMGSLFKNQSIPNLPDTVTPRSSDFIHSSASGNCISFSHTLFNLFFRFLFFVIKCIGGAVLKFRSSTICYVIGYAAFFPVSNLVASLSGVPNQTNTR